jgi:hypothetical protein
MIEILSVFLVLTSVKVVLAGGIFVSQEEERRNLMARAKIFVSGASFLQMRPAQARTTDQVPGQSPLVQDWSNSEFAIVVDESLSPELANTHAMR